MKRVILNRLILYFVLVTAILIVLFIPDRLLFESNGTVCVHRLILGIKCPICGMTRAAHEFIHLRFGKALNYNFTIFLLVFFIAADLAVVISGNARWIGLRKWALALFLAGLGILYILRFAFLFGWINIDL